MTLDSLPDIRNAARNMAVTSYLTLATLGGSLSYNAFTFWHDFEHSRTKRGDEIRTAKLEVPGQNCCNGLEVVEVGIDKQYVIVHNDGEITGLLEVEAHGLEQGRGDHKHFIRGDFFRLERQGEGEYSIDRDGYGKLVRWSARR